MDSEEALQLRLSHVANLDYSSEIMTALQSLLESKNPYAQHFRFMKDSAVGFSDVQLVFSTNNSFDSRQYNLPRIGEVAAIFTSIDGVLPGKFDFVVYSKYNSSLMKISYLNPHCDPMCFYFHVAKVDGSQACSM